MWQSKFLFFTEANTPSDVLMDDISAFTYFEEKLNELGEEGWEPYHVTEDAEGVVFLLKRWVVE